MDQHILERDSEGHRCRPRKGLGSATVRGLLELVKLRELQQAAESWILSLFPSRLQPAIKLRSLSSNSKRWRN